MQHTSLPIAGCVTAILRILHNNLLSNTVQVHARSVSACLVGGESVLCVSEISHAIVDVQDTAIHSGCVLNEGVAL